MNDAAGHPAGGALGGKQGDTGGAGAGRRSGDGPTPGRAPGWRERVAAALERIGTAIGYVGIAIVTVLTVPIVYSVIGRTMRHPLDWGFDVTLYLMIAGAFLANPWALRHGAHLRVTTFMHLFPHVEQAANRLAYAVTLLFGVVIVVGGAMMCWDSFIHDIRASSIFDIHLYIPQLVIPVGGLGLCAQALAILLRGDYPQHHVML